MEVKTLTSPDYSAYDAFVATHPHGSVFQTRKWLEYQKTAFGREGEILIGEDGGQILCSALVITHSLPIGKSYAYLPRGPLLSENAEGNRALLEAVRNGTLKRNCIFILMDPLIPKDQTLNLPSTFYLLPSTSHQPATTLVLDITRSEEEILAQMKEKGRYNIRLAGKKGVTVRPGTIDELYPLLEETARRDGFGIHVQEVYEKMLSTFAESALLLIGEHEGEILCGGIFLFDAKTGTYYYGASTSRKRELMAPYLLQWEAIREAKERGCAEYDFLGIADLGTKNHRLSGVTEFKLKFGGEIREYPPACKIVLSPFWNALYGLRSRF